MMMEEVNVSPFANLELLLTDYDKWFAIPAMGSAPPGRYKHAAQVVDGKVFVSGGSRNGRHLSDIQIFDLRTWKWANISPRSEKNRMEESLEKLPASSGHSTVHWGSKLYNIAGHLKDSSKYVTIRSIDTETLCCNAIETTGNIPIARGRHSVSIVGSKLIMFGGEGFNRELLNDIHILDLETMIWEAVETRQTPPAPRFDHTAAVNAERYLLIFGGSSHSTCFNDLHILDLQTMEWSQPEIIGEVVSARAGHAGATIGENWYIVGGGDNKSGALETLVLNMSTLVWSVVSRVKGRDPLASEGLSLCSTSIDGINLLVAFGGYNGNYHNEILVMKTETKDLVRPKIFQSPAAAAAAASVTAAYALAVTSKDLDVVNSLHMQTTILDDRSPLEEELQALEGKLSQARSENSKLRESVDEMSVNRDDLHKELQSVRDQLEAERSRCYRLEVQIADLHSKLDSCHGIEHEIETLRQQQSASANLPVLESQKSGSAWTWLAGSRQ